ncbi:MAG TPA: DUF6316 family protein [Pseudomonadales bacterium]|nr:DUF6316 family protein [Pseudomonadales bacterium]
MSDYRLGDDTPPVQRSQTRVYEEQDGWYFTTREGKAMGPYPSEEEAKQGLQDFIEFIQLAPLDTLATLTESLTPEDDSSAGN